MSSSHGFLVGVALLSLVFASCGGDERAADAAPSIVGLSTISAVHAAAIAEAPPVDLVVLDVRTPDEFAEGHLAGAVLVDFHDADFADQLAALDPDVPYLVYCRSGSRSGQTLGIMERLGFRSAVDVDGGIIAWSAAGLPVSGS